MHYYQSIQMSFIKVTVLKTIHDSFIHFFIHNHKLLPYYLELNVNKNVIGVVLIKFDDIFRYSDQQHSNKNWK